MARETGQPVYGANSVYSPKGSDFNVSVSGVTTTAVKQLPVGQGPYVVCQQSHGLFSCHPLKGKDARARFNITKQHRLCFNCLVSGHYADKCCKPSVCSMPGCGRKHTKFLRTGALMDTTFNKTNQPGTGEVTNGSVQSTTVSDNVNFPIVPVKVNHESYVTYALQDSGSTSNFIAQRLASPLSAYGMITDRCNCVHVCTRLCA